MWCSASMLLHPAVPQAAGSLVYELTTGHPERQPGELVFPADLTEELRAWPPRALGRARGRPGGGSRCGGGLLAARRLPRPDYPSTNGGGPAGAGASGDDPRPPGGARAAGTAGRPGPAPLAAPDQRSPPRRALPVTAQLRQSAAPCGSLPVLAARVRLTTGGHAPASSAQQAAPDTGAVSEHPTGRRTPGPPDAHPASAGTVGVPISGFGQPPDSRTAAAASIGHPMAQPDTAAATSVEQVSGSVQCGRHRGHLQRTARAALVADWFGTAPTRRPLPWQRAVVSRMDSCQPVAAALQRVSLLASGVQSIRERENVWQRRARAFADCQQALGIAHRDFTLAVQRDLGYGRRLRRHRWQIWRPTSDWPGGCPGPDANQLIEQARQTPALPPGT
jgi:hypothetical protein